MLSTADGRARFWAESAEENVNSDGEPFIDFRFSNGEELVSRILDRAHPSRFQISYFAGSRVTFDLQADDSGGTDLTLTEEGVPPDEHDQNKAGWVSVLLGLKAAVDFGIDLRNGDPERTWERGFVDV